WKKRVGRVGHTFTHFYLELDVCAAMAARGVAVDGEWADPAKLGELALPSVMKKVVSLGLRT
ncbi:MAG TPA: NUDIX domain-containing protein, partial [Alphaproteobacteria bacterium]|nr:NUDIX domain-containing protein [Alphaproteobacteria bacterium]